MFNLPNMSSPVVSFTPFGSFSVALNSGDVKDAVTLLTELFSKGADGINYRTLVNLSKISKISDILHKVLILTLDPTARKYSMDIAIADRLLETATQFESDTIAEIANAYISMMRLDSADTFNLLLAEARGILPEKVEEPVKPETNPFDEFDSTETKINRLIATAARSGTAVKTSTFNVNIANVVYALNFKDVQLFKDVVLALFETHRVRKALDVDKYMLMDAIINTLRCKYDNSQRGDKFSNKCITWIINKIDYMTYIVKYGRLHHFTCIKLYNFPWSDITFTNIYVTAITAMQSTHPGRCVKITKIIRILSKNCSSIPVSIQDVYAVLQYGPLQDSGILNSFVSNYKGVVHNNPETVATTHRQISDCIEYAAIHKLKICELMVAKGFALSVSALSIAIKTKTKTKVDVLVKLPISVEATDSAWNNLIELAIDNDYLEVVKKYVFKYTGDHTELIKQVAMMPSVDIATIAAIV